LEKLTTLEISPKDLLDIDWVRIEHYNTIPRKTGGWEFISKQELI
jgi:hypothetical protein